jgi:hypothetical protein
MKTKLRQCGLNWRMLLMATLSAAGPASAAETSARPRDLLEPGQRAVTFVLKDDRGQTPQLALFDSPDQSDTADSINFWRGTRGLIDRGVAVQFKGLRFLRDEVSPDTLVVRLIGVKNELELTARVALADLQRGKSLRMHFGPAAIGAGIVTGTTDAEMLLTYNAIDRTLHVAEISGQFEWKRLFHDPQSDSGELTNVSGEVGELPPGGTILKAAQK